MSHLSYKSYLSYKSQMPAQYLAKKILCEWCTPLVSTLTDRLS